MKYLNTTMPQTLKKALFLVLPFSLILAAAANATSLTASTSLTIVNVSEFRHGSASTVPTWGGDWPNDPADVTPSGQEVYMSHVEYSTHHMSWTTVPTNTPYPTFPNGVNGMIVAVWSENGGQSFIFQSWDYLATNSHGKGTEHGMPNCWMGALVHSVCDRKVGECNGQNKSNLLFSEWPTGNNSCWALGEY